jgi:hypothetical protein
MHVQTTTSLDDRLHHRLLLQKATVTLQVRSRHCYACERAGFVKGNGRQPGTFQEQSVCSWRARVLFWILVVLEQRYLV